MFVVDAQKIAHKRDVETGGTADRKVEIRKGIGAGDVVIVEGGYGLPDGTQVNDPGGGEMNSRLAHFVEAHGRAMVLIVLSFALAGFIFIFKLPISIFPQTDFPRIVILADNGITPPDIQMLTVTRPIEEAIRLVPGITNMRSVTARGSTEISVFFRWDVDILNALHLVQGRISQITPSLPASTRFYINRLTFSVFPMIGFSITSPTRTAVGPVGAGLLQPRAAALPSARRGGNAHRGRPAAGVPRAGRSRKAERLRHAADQRGGRHPQQQHHQPLRHGAGELSPLPHHRDRPDAGEGADREHGGGRGQGHAGHGEQPGKGGPRRAAHLQHRYRQRPARRAGQRAPAARRQRRGRSPTPSTANCGISRAPCRPISTSPFSTTSPCWCANPFRAWWRAS